MESGQLASSLGERLPVAASGHHPPLPRAERAVGHSQFQGKAPMAALLPVLGGAAEADGTEDGVDDLGPIVAELCQMAHATVHSGPAMPRVEIQHPFQQAASELDHACEPLLRRSPPLARGIAELAEPLYLGGELSLELRKDPVFCRRPRPGADLQPGLLPAGFHRSAR